MARWILNRPSHLCPASEQRVAQLLSTLPDDWVIRWGFYYRDNAGVNREGDFLVLGPKGGLMVLEAKGGSLDYNPRTGRWDTEDSDNPLHQLDAEWKAVLNEVRDLQGRHRSLYVEKALAVPDLELAPGLTDFHGIKRSLLLTGPELRRFSQAWSDRFSDPKIFIHADSRSVFFASYGKDISAVSISRFVDDIDLALMRQTEANFELLDQLMENRQFLVRGGTGSGKTWLAFEQACRWAEAGDGRRVLFLCYNVALAAFLKKLVARAGERGRPKRGTIHVRYWEELASGMLARAGLPYEPPEDLTMRTEFYTRQLPGLMADVLAAGCCPPEYDALVVDEAQDHDTLMDPAPEGLDGPGWWGIYYRLLREGPRSPIAAFYDPHQRPAFRVPRGFDEELLQRSFGCSPVRIALQRTVRYTRPILAFLQGLAAPGTAGLVTSLRQRGSLPDGPDVITEAVPRDAVAEAAARIARGWLDEGLCQPDDLLILSRHGRSGLSALADCATLGGCPVSDYLDPQPGSLRSTSVNKAKGLESLGVILVDFPPFALIQEPGIQASYFIGASRARQLLAVVHTEPGTVA